MTSTLAFEEQKKNFLLKFNFLVFTYFKSIGLNILAVDTLIKPVSQLQLHKEKKKIKHTMSRFLFNTKLFVGVEC